MVKKTVHIHKELFSLFSEEELKEYAKIIGYDDVEKTDSIWEALEKNKIKDNTNG